MHKVSIEDRDKLLANIKKGRNDAGGVFGGAAPYREPSPGLVVSKKKDDGQRYNHSQNDPIIIRGGQNVLPNHLVIRKHEFR